MKVQVKSTADDREKVFATLFSMGRGTYYFPLDKRGKYGTKGETSSILRGLATLDGIVKAEFMRYDIKIRIGYQFDWNVLEPKIIEIIEGVLPEKNP